MACRASLRMHLGRLKSAAPIVSQARAASTSFAGSLGASLREDAKSTVDLCFADATELSSARSTEA
jgi:hypothetical protein